VLPTALHGRVTVVDKSGRVAVELTKDAGAPLSLALPNETYSVHVENAAGEFVATVTLDRAGDLAFEQGALRRVSPEQTVARGASHDEPGEAEGDEAERPERREHGHHHHRSPWYRTVAASFGEGLRVERPATPQNFDALVTLGGTSREVHGSPVIGVAETGDLSLGLTLGSKIGFAYDMSFGIGPGVFLGDNLQLGATIGFGFSGITGDVLNFAWKVPTEGFVILELSPELRPMAYFRQDYLFGANSRKNGSKMARWGDEAEAGAGLRFSGRLDGFVYGSVREMAGVRYWGIGMGAIL
jgi:hypothetical protein